MHELQQLRIVNSLDLQEIHTQNKPFLDLEILSIIWFQSGTEDFS